MDESTLTMLLAGVAMTFVGQAHARPPAPAPLLDRLFERCDLNDDEVIDRDEFAQAVRRRAVEPARRRGPGRWPPHPDGGEVGLVGSRLLGYN